MPILKFPHLLMQKLRLSKPWRYKAPFLISVPYAVLAFTGWEAGAAFLAFGMSCCTILGIAGFGYFLNDYSDRAEDERAGKFNVTATLRPVELGLLLGFLLCLAVGPWVAYFPMDRLSWLLLGLEFGLFLLYSAPPFRLKERGFAGVLADAGYAHVVPALLAAHTFALLSGHVEAAPLAYGIVLAGWQGCVGIRNILLHQENDFAKDKATGTRTFATWLGLAAIQRWGRWMVSVGAVLYLLLGTPWPWLLPLAYVGFALQLVYLRVMAWRIGLPKTRQEMLSVWYDDFYCGWIPVVVLCALTVGAPMYGFLLLAHVLLFPNGLTRLLQQLWGIWKWKIIRRA
jgi:hypothetical protein